ncbi:MAG: hypothetical protein JXR94_07740 [Candidatus Hydrogenedentes bacterium]|nr:hypothetical protein [Candidatus Hydrogenedentota bacterium]
MRVPSESGIGAARVACVAVAVLAGWLGVFAPAAPALEHAVQVGPAEVTVFAPDWTWQNGSVNILVVADNPGPEACTVSARLDVPADFFAYDGPDTVELAVPPGDTVRGAFTNILAKPGVPLQTYDLEIILAEGGREEPVRYPLRTIRGVAFSGGRWVALLVPSGTALLWCAAFVIALRRFSAPGAWRASPPAIAEQGTRESWIDQNPA